MLRAMGNVNFSNAARMAEDIETRIKEAEQDSDLKQKVKYLILDVSGVSQMDCSGCTALVDLHRTLRHRKVKLIIVGAYGTRTPTISNVNIT